jgi:hypothetical protein
LNSICVFRFAKGLFEGVELDAKALPNKPERVAYLDKLIQHTQAVTGEQLAVRVTPTSPLTFSRVTHALCVS